MSEARQSGCGGLGTGLFLIVLGLWFFLEKIGLDLPSLAQLWPIFPLVGGLGLTLKFFREGRANAGLLFPGLGGIGLGLFFFAITLGPVRWKDLDVWWPFFPTLFGFLFITMYILGRDRDAGMLIPGVGGFLTGIFFLLITLGPLSWADMGRMWPVFSVIGGVAFLATWLGDRRAGGLLFVGMAGIVCGIGAFLVTYDLVRAKILIDAWPLVLIVVGAMIVGRAVLGRKG